MSIKPALINAIQVAEQTKNLLRAAKDLDLIVKQLEKRLAATERSLGENDILRSAVRRLRDDSLGLYQIEWNKRKEFYPDIRLAIIAKAVELLTPPKKDKDKKAPGPVDPKPK